jgi:drug/metabolite transporter (DMT)-like permease
MFPFWLFTDGSSLLDFTATYPTSRLVILFILNGASHFAQNLLAFNILSLVSPVTYSIASLVKRIFVISASIIYFGDSVSFLQGCGISMTFFGLYLYNEAKRDVANKERIVVEIQEGRSSTGTLPTHSEKH